MSQFVMIPAAPKEDPGPMDCSQFSFGPLDTLKLYSTIQYDPDAGVFDFPFLLIPPDGSTRAIAYNDTIWTYAIVGNIDHSMDYDGDGSCDGVAWDFAFAFEAITGDSVRTIYSNDHMTGSFSNCGSYFFWRVALGWVTDECPCCADSVKFRLRITDNLQPERCADLGYVNPVTRYSYPFTIERKPVVTVHGWGSGSPASFATLQELLRQDCHVVRDFDYSDDPSSVSIETLAARLSSAITSWDNPDSFPASTLGVDLIAHSMGGLISRYYVAHYPEHTVDKLVTLGSPFYGADLARLVNMNPQEVQGQQMKFGSRFTVNLHDSAQAILRRRADVLTIAGAGSAYADEDDGIVDIPSASLPGFGYRTWFVPYDHGGLASVTNPDHESYWAIQKFFAGTLPSANESAVSAHTDGMLILRLRNAAGNPVGIGRRFLGFPVYPPAVTWVGEPPRPPCVPFFCADGVNRDDGISNYYATDVPSGTAYSLRVTPEPGYKLVTGTFQATPRQTTVMTWVAEAADAFAVVEIPSGSTASHEFTGTNASVQPIHWPGGGMSMTRVDEPAPFATYPSLPQYWLASSDIPDSSSFLVRLSLNYDAAAVASAGFSESSLRVAYLNEGWQVFATTVDTSANMLHVETGVLPGPLAIVSLPSVDSVQTMTVHLTGLGGGYGGACGPPRASRTAAFNLGVPIDSVVSVSLALCGMGSDCYFMGSPSGWSTFTGSLSDSAGGATGWSTLPFDLYGDCVSQSLRSAPGGSWQFLKNGRGSVTVEWGSAACWDYSCDYLSDAILTIQTRRRAAAVAVFAPPAQTSAPGVLTSYEFQVKNLGEASDRFTLEALKSLPEWPVYYPLSVGPIAPGATVPVAVTTLMPSGWTGDALNLITVRARSQADPAVSAEATTVVTTGIHLSLFQGAWGAGGVELRWRFSQPSESADVALERGDRATGPWVVVAGERRDEAGTTVVVDGGVEAGRPYWYRLTAKVGGNDFITIGSLLVAAGIAEREFALLPIVPTPSRGRTRLEFTVPHEAQVSLRVLDVQGRRVALLAAGKYRAGRHEALWDGMVDGRRAAAGLYFVSYEAPGKSVVRRLVILR